MSTLVKICGLKTAETLDVAVHHGAAMIGFNFFERSPRYIPFDQAAMLANRMPHSVERVGLLVDPDDDTLDAVLGTVPLDVIQLHGRETPARVAAIRYRHGLPVMKAIGVASRDDVETTAAFRQAADRLLLDARPPAGAERPGGNAQAFDWTLLQGWDAPMPWLLAGGLTIDNVRDAIATSGAPGIDLSSGVESAPGVKSIDAIARFMATVRRLEGDPGASSGPRAGG